MVKLIIPKKPGINDLTYRPGRAPYFNSFRLTTSLAEETAEEASPDCLYECGMCGSPCSSTKYCAHCNTHLYTRVK